MLRTIPGVKNLNAIIASSSSARMLDLHALAEVHGETEGYRDLPMFAHPLLNRAIIVKHNVAPGEEERLAPRRFNATKVIFPLDPNDLNLGGQLLFVEQHDFVGVLSRHLEYGDLPLHRDVTVLRVLDKLPTLDPFLVREALAREDIEVDRCYFRFSEPDKVQMLSFVESEMGSLIRLCFGELKPGDGRARRLSRLLLADEESPDLAPLQLTLQMDDAAFTEAIFAWKALLYYRWRTQTLMPTLRGTLRSISRLGRKRCTPEAMAFLVGARTLLERAITRSWKEIGQTLKLYDRAYTALIEAQDPESFRRFLMQGSGLFLDLGERIGRLEQVVSFWAYRLAKHDTAAMSPDEVMDEIRDLLQGLSIWPGEEEGPVLEDIFDERARAFAVIEA